MVQAAILVCETRTPEREQAVNVGRAERALSVAGGVLIAIDGIRRINPIGVLLGGLGAALIYRGVSGRCPLYERLHVNTRRSHGPVRPSDFYEKGVHVSESVTIQRPAQSIYDLWRGVENLPVLMTHLRSVTALDDRRSHWVANAPAGFAVEWDAEIIVDEPGQRIAWRSLEGADVDSRGTVQFVDLGQGRGTEVRVTLEYIPPAGRLGAGIARLFGEDPQTQIRDDLARLKLAMEGGGAAECRRDPALPLTPKARG